MSAAPLPNLDVIQEVEYVKQEAKVVYLLECLQKTAPPVLIFCEKKQDVDDIHEYLLLKGVEAVSIHGGKDQDERNEAIAQFKDTSKDVLVATDIAAKGLDFPDIQHVINFDMPSEIENYVHRIGRTGRCVKTAWRRPSSISRCRTSLLDLKSLWWRPSACRRLAAILTPSQGGDGRRGPFTAVASGRIADCPKRDKNARQLGAGQRTRELHWRRGVVGGEGRRRGEGGGRGKEKGERIPRAG